MKKLLYTLILMLAAVGLHAQYIPPNAPTAISPNFTWYKKITAGDTSFFAYSNGNWVNFARRNWVKKYVDSISNKKANLLGGNSFTGGFNNFRGGVGADNIYLTSYARTLVPGETATGFTSVIASQNNGPFLGVEIDRAKLPTMRFGESAGGGSFVVQKNIGIGSENWVNVFKTDSASVTASNGLTQIGSDIQLGGAFTKDNLIDGGNFSLTRNYLTELDGNVDYLTMNESSANGFSAIAYKNYSQSAVAVNGTRAAILSTAGDKSAQIYLDSTKLYLQLQQGSKSQGLGISQSGMSVNDLVNSRGLEYAFNYGANFTDYSLVDKRYVDSLNTASASTASNGLTKIGGDVQLGGALSSPISIEGGSNPFFRNYNTPSYVNTLSVQESAYDGFNISAYRNGAQSGFNTDGGSAGISANSSAGASSSQVYLDSTKVVVQKNTLGQNKSLILTDYGFYVTDDANHKGAEYQANYRGNFTNLSLVDKGYVDSVNTNSTLNYAKLNVDNAYGNHSGTYSTTNKVTNIGTYGLTVEKNNSGENYLTFHDTSTDQYLLGTPKVVGLQDGPGNYVTSLQVGGFVNKNLGAAYPTYLNFEDATGVNKALTFPNETGVLATRDYVTTAGAGSLLKSGGTMAGDLILPSITPTNALSAAPKGYIDNLLTGITWKNAVRVKTTGNITLSGTQTVDGISLVAGNRILVGSQTAPAQNGIYLVATGAWTRVTDADESSELEQATVLVTVGTANKNTQWTYIGGAIPVIGTDPIYFGQISGAGTYTNGSYLSLSGNVFDANLTAFDGRYEVLSNKKATLTNSSTDYPSTSAVTSALGGYVPTSRTVAGFPLTSNITLATHTMGYGFLGGNYTGANAITTAIDTAGTVVSRLNLASQMPLKLSKTDTTAMLSAIVHKAIDETITGTKTLTKTLKGISFENSTNANFSSVSTTATGTIISRNVADGNIPLIVNNVSGSSFIQQWQQNGTGVAGINTNGTFYLNGFSNTATTNNAYLILPTTGAVISRNQADANPALIVNLSNAGATGAIQQWQSSVGGVAVLNNVGSFSTLGRIAIGTTSSPQALFQMSNTAYSSGSAFSTLGLASRQDNITLNSFAATTTSAFAAVNSLGIATLTANNNQTIGTTATLYIAGAPVLSNAAGGTLTTTNGAYALWVNGGNAYFGSSLISNGPIIQNTSNAYASGSYTTLVRNATGRYETIDLTAFNSTTTALSSATLNSAYPSAALGFRVICGNITAGGIVYLKYAASTWLAIAAPVQP